MPFLNKGGHFVSDIGSKNREASDKLLEETTLSTQSIFEGKIISLQVDTVKLPNGGLRNVKLSDTPAQLRCLL